MARKKAYVSKRLGTFKKGSDHPNYKVRKSYTPVYNRGKKQIKVKSPDVIRPCKRYTDTEFKELIKPSISNPLSIPGADGIEGSARLLRPIKTPPPQAKARALPNRTYNMDNGNILVEKSRLLSLINTSIAEHQATGDCESVEFDIVDMTQWGLFISGILKCKNCQYRSERTKLFDEVAPTGKSGRRAASGNMRLQLALQDSPIHNTDAQLLIASMGLRPGSLNGMQKMGYRAAAITEQVGEEDLVRQQEYVINILKERGVQQPEDETSDLTALLSGSFDGRYHGVFKGSACTPGTGAAQATGIFAENLTERQAVLGFDHINMMCPKGARRMGKGQVVICGGPNSHDGCTATQPRETGISERLMGQRIATKLYDSSKIAVSHLCTDGDAKGKLGFSDANEKINQKILDKEQGRQTRTKGNSQKTKWKNKSTKTVDEAPKLIPELTSSKDPVHLTWSMSRKIKDYKFSSESFGVKESGKPWNYKEREECRKVIASDIPSRVAITIRNMKEYYAGDTKKIRNKADIVCTHMLKCYNGEHKSHKRSPLAHLTGCYGQDNCWVTNSETLKAQGITSMKFTQKETEFLRSVIGMKLSSGSIDMVSRGHSSSRVEGCNRAFTKSNPNNRNYARISLARAHSAIGRINNGQLQFSDMKFKAGGCVLPSDSEPQKVLCNYQHRRTLIDAARNTPQSRQRQRTLSNERKRLYAQARRKLSNLDEYRKFQLDEAETAHEEAQGTADTNKAKSHLDKIRRTSARHHTRKRKAKERANAKRKEAMKERSKAKRKAVKSAKEVPAILDHGYARTRPKVCMYILKTVYTI